MESVADEWQVVKPKKQKKQKQEKPNSQPPVPSKPASSGANSKPKNGKGKTASSSPTPQSDAQPGKSGGQTAQRSDKKKSESKRSSVMKMPLNTVEQMAHFIRELVVNTPPPSNRLAIAAIGERVLSITKNSWSKKYKNSFGSLRSFLESQTELFTVIGDDVFLAGTVRAPSPAKSSAKLSAKPSQTDSKAKQPAPSVRQSTKQQEATSKPSSRTAKKSSKAVHHSPRDGHKIGCLKAVAVVGLLGAVILFTLASVNVIDLKALQRFAQQKFISKR